MTIRATIPKDEVARLARDIILNTLKRANGTNVRSDAIVEFAFDAAERFYREADKRGHILRMTPEAGQ